MTNRERFRAAMAFEATDRPCHVEHGFWRETYLRWRGEGLPATVHEPVLDCEGPRPDLFDHFGLTRMAYVLRGQYYVPPFEELVLEETDRYRVVRDALGRTLKESKAEASLPQELDHPVKTARDYEALRERLQPCPDLRYPADWDALADRMRRQQDQIVCTHMHGFFAHPRELMGVTHMLTAFYTDPDLMRRIIDDRCAFYQVVYEKALRDIRPDFAFIWEDMSFRDGPLISPDLFREFLLPAYRELTDFIRSMGVETIVVDSDGDVRALIPLWMEGGVTACLPFEAKTGMDVVQVAQAFPRLRILGGVNKHCLERNREDIDAEVDRVLRPLLRRGGYCAALDHWVNPEIPLHHFAHYVDRVRGAAP